MERQAKEGASVSLRLNALPDNLYERSTATGQESLNCVDYLPLIKNEPYEFGILDFISLDVFSWDVFDDVISKQDYKLAAKHRSFVKFGDIIKRITYGFIRFELLACSNPLAP